MKKTLPFIIIHLFYYPISAQTTISGSIGGMTFKPAGNRQWVKPASIGTVSLGIILLGTMSCFIYSSADYDKKYNNADDYDDSLHYLINRDDAVKNAIITGIIGGVFVSTGTGLFLWEHKKRVLRRQLVFIQLPVVQEAFS